MADDGKSNLYTSKSNVDQILCALMLPWSGRHSNHMILVIIQWSERADVVHRLSTVAVMG